jgi:hypothetical protein
MLGAVQGLNITQLLNDAAYNATMGNYTIGEPADLKKFEFDWKGQCCQKLVAILL